MRYLILALALFALAACPKKETPAPVADAAQKIEDGGGEDVVVMDALVIDGSLPD